MKVRDPVCSREMEPGNAAGVEDHDGWAHFFCSPTCQEEFRAAPAQYVQNPSRHRSTNIERGD